MFVRVNAIILQTYNFFIDTKSPKNKSCKSAGKSLVIAWFSQNQGKKLRFCSNLHPTRFNKRKILHSSRIVFLDRETELALTPSSKVTHLKKPGREDSYGVPSHHPRVDLAFGSQSD